MFILEILSVQCLISMCPLRPGTSLSFHLAAHLRTRASCQHAGHLLLTYTLPDGGAVTVPPSCFGYAH